MCRFLPLLLLALHPLSLWPRHVLPQLCCQQFLICFMIHLTFESEQPVPCSTSLDINTGATGALLRRDISICSGVYCETWLGVVSALFCYFLRSQPRWLWTTSSAPSGIVNAARSVGRTRVSWKRNAVTSGENVSTEIELRERVDHSSVWTVEPEFLWWVLSISHYCTRMNDVDCVCS